MRTAYSAPPERVIGEFLCMILSKFVKMFIPQGGYYTPSPTPEMAQGSNTPPPALPFIEM